MKIDLAGPDGNAFTLLNIAHQVALQCSLSKEQARDITSRMRAADYDNLLNILDY